MTTKSTSLLLPPHTPNAFLIFKEYIVSNINMHFYVLQNIGDDRCAAFNLFNNAI